MDELKRIVVTGGAGRIAYALLFRIAAGELLGKKQPIALHILETAEAMSSLEGVVMELTDSAFPLLREIHIGSDPKKVFQGADFAMLVGSTPRLPGMERKDLLLENGKIFIEQGRALNEVAKPSVKVLVVGNPCNTNCLICMTHAPNISRRNFHAMTRLDQNRATSHIAVKAKVSVEEVKNMIIWGNHSLTQVPDFYHAKVQQKSVKELIDDEDWLESFTHFVQRRGAEVLKIRGKSSAASAASAAIDAMRALLTPTAEGEWFCSAVCTDHNPYGLHPNLIFSLPCRSQGDGEYEIVPRLTWSGSIKQKILESQDELLEERELFFSLKVSPLDNLR